MPDLQERPGPSDTRQMGERAKTDSELAADVSDRKFLVAFGIIILVIGAFGYALYTC